MTRTFVAFIVAFAVTAESSGIQGWFTDPNHNQPRAGCAGATCGALQGSRIIARGTDAGSVVVVGTDNDGVVWQLSGQLLESIDGDLMFSVNFKPKARRAGILQGSWSSAEEQITWSDGNAWKLSPLPSFKRAQPDSQFDGIYRDLSPGAEGIRVVTDRIGTENSHQITIVGTEDGIHVWSAFGHDVPVREHRGHEFQFTAQLPNTAVEATASFAQGVITWGDGSEWVKLTTATASDSEL